jgi:pimeloyl-ACP methyl ester carboxylesterase
MSGASGGRIDTVVSSDGTEIAYQTVGEGPGVLLVPGALAIASDFDEFARELADRFTVHTIERRGRGQSGPQGHGYSIDSECDDVKAVQAATGAKLLARRRGRAGSTRRSSSSSAPPGSPLETRAAE